MRNRFELELLNGVGWVWLAKDEKEKGREESDVWKCMER